MRLPHSVRVFSFKTIILDGQGVFDIRAVKLFRFLSGENTIHFSIMTGGFHVLLDYFPVKVISITKCSTDLSIGLTKWWGATRQQDKRKSQTGWKEALNRNMFDKPLDWRYTLRRLKVHISVVVSLSHEARLNPILKYEGTCNEKSKAVSPSHNLSFHLPCFLSLWGELCSSRPWLCRRGQKKEWQQRKKKVGKEEGCRDEGPWCRQCWFEE